MTALDEAYIAATKKQESQGEFYTVFLNTNIFIPTHNIPKEEKQRRAGEEEDIQPIIIESEGLPYLVLFDTKERLSAWAQREVGFVAVPGHAVTAMAGPNLHWLLNPSTEYSKVFVPDEIKWLQEFVAKSKGQDMTLGAGTNVITGAPASIPDGLIDSLTAKLVNNQEVKEAHLGQINYQKEGEKPHLALVLTLETSSAPDTIKAILEDLAIGMKGILGEDDAMDFFLNDGNTVSAGILEAVKPFYVKS